MRKLDYEIIKKDIAASANSSSVYVGCDSSIINRKTVFALVVIIHIESSKGGKCYAQKFFENRRMEMAERLLKEVELSVQCALQLIDVIGNRNFEIHLDINPNAEHKSNKVLNSAVGYVKSVGVEYQIKPHAFAASTAADYLLH